MPRNGCGNITFGTTLAEAETSKNAFIAEREVAKAKTRENIKANKPERVAAHIEKATAKINRINNEIAELSEELAAEKDSEQIVRVIWDNLI